MLHRAAEEKNTQDRAEDDLIFQRSDLFLPRGFNRIRDVILHFPQKFIPLVCDHRGQSIASREVISVKHGRAARSQIDLRVSHPRNAFEGVFHSSNTSSACHPADGHCHFIGQRRTPLS